MSEAFKALGINGPFLLAQIINFLILFLALRAILWKPLMQQLQERREMLQQQKEDAEVAAEAAAKAREEIKEERQQALEKAHSEAQEIIEEAEERAANLKEQTLQEAQQEADRLINEAQQEAKEERNQILDKVRGLIAELATAAAQRIVGQELNEKRQHALIDSFFSGVREGKVEILPEDLKRPADGRITVISALPLTNEEKAAIRDDLTRRVEGELDVIFQVDPEILGGLVVEIGNRVVDGSVGGQLKQLQESLT
ncbi:MAG: F0F1 ATP synthase subunit B [Anaerolineales bacterium]